MFPEQRSVAYNDDSLRTAVEQVATFEANFGGTVIYEPLMKVFSQQKSADVVNSHIYLLTDGAIWDTNQVINLIS